MKLTVTQTYQFDRQYLSRFSLAIAILNLGSKKHGPFSSIILRYRNPNERARSFKLISGTVEKLETPDAFFRLCEELVKHEDIHPFAEVELILNFL
jgi:hypothetical protein